MSLRFNVWAILCSILMCNVLPVWAFASEQAAKTSTPVYWLTGVELKEENGGLDIHLQGEGSLAYTHYYLPEPDRVVVDIADAAINDTVLFPFDFKTGPVSKITGKVLVDREPFIVKIEIYTDSSSYSALRIADDIHIHFDAVEGKATVEKDSLQNERSMVANEIHSIDVKLWTEKTIVTLKANKSITEYRELELPKGEGRPYRMYIDLPNMSDAGIDKKIIVPEASPLARIRTAVRDDGIRVVFDSSMENLFQYSTTPVESGLQVVISHPVLEEAEYSATMVENSAPTMVENSAPTMVEDSASTMVEDSASTMVEDSASTMVEDSALIMAEEPVFTVVEDPAFAIAEEPPPVIVAEKSSQIVESKEKTALDIVDPVAKLLQSMSQPQLEEKDVIGKQLARAGVMVDKFAAAGFKKQRISVDFYKIDLHNVFRLFGEISKSNMIIDQAVTGTLSLALNEVPWDFAMDIILNMKDLQKEERFNTIVISPKDKIFNWPEEPEKALEITAPTGDIKIAIEKNLEIAPGLMEAKKMMYQASRAEKNNDYVEALALYEKAFDKWPQNGGLARRIASLCLVHMGLNSKAFHYAKSALNLDGNDRDAALQAAISAANMRKQEAETYFEHAVSFDRPNKMALLNFATFSEQKGGFDKALALLNRYVKLYGDSLETMIAKAGIYDRAGQKENAFNEYQAIIFSGYELDNDLKRYIKGRLAMQ